MVKYKSQKVRKVTFLQSFVNHKNLKVQKLKKKKNYDNWKAAGFPRLFLRTRFFFLHFSFSFDHFFCCPLLVVKRTWRFSGHPNPPKNAFWNTKILKVQGLKKKKDYDNWKAAACPRLFLRTRFFFDHFFFPFAHFCLAHFWS